LQPNNSFPAWLPSTKNFLNLSPYWNNILCHKIT
jgi:hypothetical protein